MKGFTKLLATDFDTFNNQATVKYIAQTGDTSCDEYTTFRPDTDPLYVWARIEHDFITAEPVLSLEDAIASGMADNSEEI